MKVSMTCLQVHWGKRKGKFIKPGRKDRTIKAKREVVGGQYPLHSKELGGGGSVESSIKGGKKVVKGTPLKEMEKVWA